jgi:hypothetical protein
MQKKRPEPPTRARKYRRFDLQVPVCLSFPKGGDGKLRCTSKNVSIGGLLVKADDSLPLQTPVALTIEVKGLISGRTVRLLGEGEVVRVERLEADSGYAIAVACRRPIAEIENHLSAAS